MGAASIAVTGRLVVRNTLLNLMGQVVPLALAVLFIPYTIHRLGSEQYGIWSLASIVLGYFAFLDLGFGRTATKFVAEALGRGDTSRIREIVWTSVLLTSLSGLLATTVGIVSTPLFVERILHIPTRLIREAEWVFYITSVSLLVEFVSSGLSGVLEAYQRFDVINAVKVPSKILTSAIPVLVLVRGGGLTTIVAMLVLKNAVVALIFLSRCIKCLPPAGLRLPINVSLTRSLFNFGGWLALHNAAGAVLLYLDRFFVGVLLTLSAVTYYSAPYDLVTRALIIPASAIVVLFPAFSYLDAADPERLRTYFARALKFLIVTMGILTGVFVVFSKEIMFLWLGQEFVRSAPALRTLAVGVFLTAGAWLTGTLLQGVGASRAVAIVHVIQVPLYVPLSWFLVKALGIDGAALSWTIRALVSFVLLLMICWRRRLFHPADLVRDGSLKLAAVVWLISAGAATARSLVSLFPLPVLPLALLAFVALALVGVWRWALSDGDRLFFESLAVRTHGAFILLRRREKYAP